MKLDEWVRKARGLGASDVHLEAQTPVVARIEGELLTIADGATASELADLAESLLGTEAWRSFLARGSADISSEISGTRCRLNFYQTVRGVAIAIRLLTASINDLRACNLHPDLRRFSEPSTGLVILSGPTGSGKSTTLAAMVEEINGSRARNIISIESPLEYLFRNRRSFIRQREVPTHSPSYEQAIIDALRENPDVLVIGEMRTPEVMRLTLNAAETGHLVLATMHSATCAEALSRLCMSFAAEIQPSIRAQVADCLVGVVCQRLDFVAPYRIRVPRCEILTGNSAAKGTIRTGQFSQLPTVIQSGGEDGMWSFERYGRWMAQKTDWVLQSPVAPITDRESSSPSAAGTRPIIQSPAPPEPNEISIDEDLDLAEIARKLDEGR